MTLAYVGDPLCVYCYAFGHPLRATGLDARCRLVVGGLRPRERRQPWTPAFRSFVRPHWRRVQAWTGRSMHPSLVGNERGVLDRHGYLDTELADRAVVAARAQDATSAFPMFEAIGRAFYEQGCDPHDVATYVALARSLGLDGASLGTALVDPSNEAQTWADFATAQGWGVTSFPTLMQVDVDPPQVVVRGYIDAEELQRRVEGVPARFRVLGLTPLSPPDHQISRRTS